MNIAKITPQKERMLHVVFECGREGIVDIGPYLASPAFKPLENWEEFSMVRNGGYFVEWPCGADLSADTLETRLLEFELGR